MRKVTHLVIAALALQFFVGGVSAEAAPAPLRIIGVTASGLAVTVKWNPVVITSKDFFEVEFTKSSSTKAFKVIKRLQALLTLIMCFASSTAKLTNHFGIYCIT